MYMDFTKKELIYEYNGINEYCLSFLCRESPGLGQDGTTAHRRASLFTNKYALAHGPKISTKILTTDSFREQQVQQHFLVYTRKTPNIQ